MRNPSNKVLTTQTLTEWRRQLKQTGKKLVVTNGCFDIMHRGHAEYLYKARENGDALLVLLNGDRSIQEIKGPTRPVINEENRTYMLASLECVDAVIIFNDPRATEWFRLIRPDVYVKGADYTEDTLNREEYLALKEGDCSFEFIEFVEGCSTSNIVNKILTTH